MQERLQNILWGIGSTLQIKNDNRTPSLLSDAALGEIKKFRGSPSNDVLKIHRDIEIAWKKAVETKNER